MLSSWGKFRQWNLPQEVKADTAKKREESRKKTEQNKIKANFS